MLVAKRDAPTSGQGRLRSARKKLALSADDFFRMARYRPRRMLELKTTRQMVQSTRPREKDIGGFRDNLRARYLLYANAGGVNRTASRLEARFRSLGSKPSVNDPIATRYRDRRRTEEEGD